MSTPTPEDRVQAAYDAIDRVDLEAKRMREQIRVDFGAVVNDVVDAKEMKQDDVVTQTGKTREWVRRYQVKARKS